MFWSEAFSARLARWFEVYPRTTRECWAEVDGGNLSVERVPNNDNDVGFEVVELGKRLGLNIAPRCLPINASCLPLWASGAIDTWYTLAVEYLLLSFMVTCEVEEKLSIMAGVGVERECDKASLLLCYSGRILEDRSGFGFWMSF